MPYTILVTPTATDDIAAAIEYYNALAADLGYRFADLVADYFDRIAELPTASAVRYRNVRCKPMKRFPYLITFTIDEATHSVNILRVFNTYQEPLH
ncbi:MAG: type II toxin-antitoxin system RelE/ParE family toxin [Chitinophagaceae bacterium]|nr:type II toxin-antitoxin system RelE/ParE family toxin [Chitinophagaceae bacterium]